MPVDDAARRSPFRALIVAESVLVRVANAEPFNSNVKDAEFVHAWVCRSCRSSGLTRRRPQTQTGIARTECRPRHRASKHVAVLCEISVTDTKHSME